MHLDTSAARRANGHAVNLDESASQHAFTDFFDNVTNSITHKEHKIESTPVQGLRPTRKFGH